MPRARTRADVFLSCHRQADPSCTYLESMGCGLAVAGYDNAMWSALQAQSQAGWTAPLGDPAALARRIIEVDADRNEILRCCRHARDFAGAHNFNVEFTRRLDHLHATLAA